MAEEEKEFIDIDLGQVVGADGTIGENGKNNWVKWNTIPEDDGALTIEELSLLTPEIQATYVYRGEQLNADIVQPETGYFWRLFKEPKSENTISFIKYQVEEDSWIGTAIPYKIFISKEYHKLGANINAFVQADNEQRYDDIYYDNGNITIESRVKWNGRILIAGGMTEMVDVTAREALKNKQDKLEAGSNITIENGVINAAAGDSDINALKCIKMQSWTLPGSNGYYQLTLPNGITMQRVKALLIIGDDNEDYMTWVLPVDASESEYVGLFIRNVTNVFYNLWLHRDLKLSAIGMSIHDLSIYRINILYV